MDWQRQIDDKCAAESRAKGEASLGYVFLDCLNAEQESVRAELDDRQVRNLTLWRYVKFQARAFAPSLALAFGAPPALLLVFYYAFTWVRRGFGA
ncbi:MAG: hypothetical protein ACREVZ_15320 [Burkholderiales bacterium]